MVALDVSFSIVDSMAKIAREFSKYFEKLLEMFARLGDGLPRFKTYERLFPNHRALIQKLSDVYLEIILFCISAKAVFRHAKRASSESHIE